MIKEEKICNVCGKLKKLGEFVVSQTNSDGRKSRCKPCSAIISKQWRKDNLQLNRAIQVRYYNKVKEANKKTQVEYVHGIQGLTEISQHLKNL